MRRMARAPPAALAMPHAPSATGQTIRRASIRRLRPRSEMTTAPRTPSASVRGAERSARRGSTRMAVATACRARTTIARSAAMTTRAFASHASLTFGSKALGKTRTVFVASIGRGFAPCSRRERACPIRHVRPISTLIPPLLRADVRTATRAATRAAARGHTTALAAISMAARPFGMAGSASLPARLVRLPMRQGTAVLATPSVTRALSRLTRTSASTAHRIRPSP